MIYEMQGLREEYLSWLRDNITLRGLDEWVEITTPFLDRHNDCMQIYAKLIDGGYVLTDHAYTIDDLEFCGCKLDTSTRKQLLQVTLNGFGVKKIDNALQVKATSGDFALQMQNLLQAMLAVNDLYYTSRSNVANAFAEEVALWLQESDMQFRRDVEFAGMSGLNVRFDFVIPKNEVHPNFALWGIGNPSLATAKKTVFDWHDTKDAREEIYVPYAVLGEAISDNAKNVFLTYGINPIFWANRKPAREELAS